MAGYCTVGGQVDATKTTQAACAEAGGTWTQLDSSQESTVTFNGEALGKLTGWNLTAGAAVMSDATSVESQVIGEGDQTRILKEVHCVAIDPGRLQVRLFGCPPFMISDIGTRATLEVEFEGGSLTCQAILDTFDVEAVPGDLLKGQVSFYLTGN